MEGRKEGKKMTAKVGWINGRKNEGKKRTVKEGRKKGKNDD